MHGRGGRGRASGAPASRSSRSLDRMHGGLAHSARLEQVAKLAKVAYVTDPCGGLELSNFKLTQPLSLISTVRP